MSLGEENTHYDALDITPDASPQEVREAYVRVKATYTRDSAALYTLVSPEEREQILLKIEEAYQILSDPEKRRDYDRHHGLLGTEFMPEHESFATKVVSIDRVPPMESARSTEDLLIPPSTDFAAAPPTPPMPPSAPPPNPREERAISFSGSAPSHAPDPFLDYPPAPPKTPGPIESRSSTPVLDLELSKEIEAEKEWRGQFLRKIRDAYKMSLEEMSGITKISKHYIQAIEEENFARLPAPVYVRGFVSQMAKQLKLPADRVASAYLARFNQAQKP